MKLFGADGRSASFADLGAERGARWEDGDFEEGPDYGPYDGIGPEIEIERDLREGRDGNGVHVVEADDEALADAVLPRLHHRNRWEGEREGVSFEKLKHHRKDRG